MHERSTGSDPSPSQTLLTFRIIGASLGIGVTLFAGVSWVVRQQGGPVATLPLDSDTLLALLLGLTVVALAASILFWRARVAPLIDRGTAAHPEPDADRGAEINSRVMVCWGLVELPAMLAVTLYLLEGHAWAALYGVVLIWTALGLTWPQPGWYDSRT